MYLAPAAAHNCSRETIVCMDDEGRRECFPDICSTRKDTLAAQHAAARRSDSEVDTPYVAQMAVRSGGRRPPSQELTVLIR